MEDEVILNSVLPGLLECYIVIVVVEGGGSVSTFGAFDAMHVAGRGSQGAREEVGEASNRDNELGRGTTGSSRRRHRDSEEGPLQQRNRRRTELQRNLDVQEVSTESGRSSTRMSGTSSSPSTSESD